MLSRKVGHDQPEPREVGRPWEVGSGEGPEATFPPVPSRGRLHRAPPGPGQGTPGMKIAAIPAQGILLPGVEGGTKAINQN